MAAAFHTHLVPGSGRRRDFSVTIMFAIVAMIAAAFVLALAGVYWATHESDAVSVERQARSVRHAMEASVDELALQQETVAIWDDSVEHMVADRHDLEWMHGNLGSWLHRIFGHDEVYALDGSDKPVYAAIGGQQVPPSRYYGPSSELKYLVNSVRGRDSGSNGVHDRNPHRPLSRKSTVRTTSRATHDSHIILLGGRPAAASAMLMKPSTAGYVQPKGNWPVLVSVRYLDEGFLGELSARNLIDAPRFSTNGQLATGEHRIDLRAEWGQLIGYLIWKPELPGSRILWKLIPINLLLLAGLAMVMLLLGRRLRNVGRELATAEAQAAHLAFHDSLTGLPNRALFQRRLDDMASAAGAGGGFALVLLDVDDFKLINDTLGHDAGDAVLIAFAERLRMAVRSTDLVARLGGDEFAVLLSCGNGPPELESFSAKLLELLDAPCEHRGKMIACHASIGASLSGDGEAPSDVLKHADLALYETKASGRGGYRLYKPEMWANMLRRGEMLSLASVALKGDFVEPYYQPKIDLVSGAVVGFEALLRCCLPNGEPQGPGIIAAAFDDAGLALALSDRMVDGVIRDIEQWRSAGLRFGHVAINAALAELHRGDFAHRLLDKLERAGIPPDCVQVEVTESVLLGRGIEHVEQTFNQLAQAGVRLALDDFGTGFASLTHLKRFPIEIIKIDRSFVRDLQIDAEDGAIVDALIRLGRALGIEVVAEGIETAAQRDFLAALGCRVGQGFLFGSAVPARDIITLLEGKSGPKGRQAAA
jgi:diguanylate cyclase (GGDEF)-like protein